MHALEGAQVRVARPARRYADVLRFYELVGPPVLAQWEGEAGLDGTVCGLPDASCQLEILRDWRLDVKLVRVLAGPETASERVRFTSSL